MGDADLAEAEALRPVRHRFHLYCGYVAGRRFRPRLGGEHHRGVARHLVRLQVARAPAGERRVPRQMAAEAQVGVVQARVGRRVEADGDPLVLGLGQLGRAVLQVLPFGLHLAGESLDAQRLDQDLDPRLVLVVAPPVAVVDPQDGLDVGQQVAPVQAVADLLAEDRRAPQAAAHQHAQAHFTGFVAVEVEADVVHLDRRAVFFGGAEGDLELARQEEELRVDGRPLAEDLGHRARVQQLVGGYPGKGFGGDVAHAVAGGLDGVHLHLGQLLEDVRHFGEFDPVELDVLPGGEVAVAAVVLAGDARQAAQLVRRQGAVGDGDPQHVGVLLQVQAVLQAQRQELFLAQLTADTPRHLVAELRHALQHQGAVVVVVVVHRRLQQGGRGPSLWAREQGGNSFRSVTKNRIRSNRRSELAREARPFASKLAPTQDHDLSMKKCLDLSLFPFRLAFQNGDRSVSNRKART
ncbi:hypothetical protein D3C80_904290 [compost metagenome]